MKVNCYAVRDEVAQVFKYDFKRTNHGLATRFFGDGVQEQGTEFSKHPQDFTLYWTAVYDNETGRYENLELPERICSAMDFVPLTAQPTNGGV